MTAVCGRFRVRAHLRREYPGGAPEAVAQLNSGLIAADRADCRCPLSSGAAVTPADVRAFNWRRIRRQQMLKPPPLVKLASFSSG